MKSLKEINKILQSHERRISVLELVRNKSKPQRTIKNQKTLSDHIIELRDARFFSQPKTAEETHAKIVGKYHCELNRVEVALIRLAGRKKLRKASKTANDKKYKAYVW